MKIILWMFVIFTAFNILIATLAPQFIAYNGHFSHPKVLQEIDLPHYVKSFANFDGIFYIRIARDWYSQFEHAFFPLYPILMQVLAPLFGNNYLLAGLFISNASFLFGLVVFYKYLLLINSDVKAQRVKSSSKSQNPKRHLTFELWILIFLMTFPTSFFFTAVYTESLFFLLTTLTFYFLQTKHFKKAGATALFAATTRFIGVFLFIPILILVWKARKKLWPLVLTPFAGLGIYMFYLWRTTGDALAFFTSQTAFAAGRSTELVFLPQVYWRYLKILTTANINFSYFIATLEILTFTLFLGLVLFGFVNWYRQRHIPLIALSSFSLINLLMPTMTGTFLSIPRFAILSLSAFVVIGSIRSMYIKIVLGLIFLVIHIVLIAYFVQGHFVS